MRTGRGHADKKGSGTLRAWAPTTCTHGASTLHASLNLSLVFLEKGGKKATRRLFCFQTRTACHHRAGNCHRLPLPREGPVGAAKRSYQSPEPEQAAWKHVSRTENPGDRATGRHAGPWEAPVQMLPQLRALPGVVKGPKRPQQVQGNFRGKIFHQIPIVWKDSSLRGSGPKCRLKPSEWLSSLSISSIQTSVSVCVACVCTCACGAYAVMCVHMFEVCMWHVVCVAYVCACRYVRVHPVKEAKPTLSGWQCPLVFAKLTQNRSSTAWPLSVRPC